MKILNIKKAIVFSLAVSTVACFTSCQKFMDINETPNNPLEVPPTVLLPSALSGAAFINGNELNRFGSTIMSVTAGIPNSSPSNYDVYINNGADFNNQWRFELYDGVLINSDELIKSADRVDGPAYRGIAKIMKAYAFALATDTWGDIPYSEALKGEELLSPRLDSQRDIYLGNESLGIQSLFDLIRDGLADLDMEGLSTPGSDDIVYGGDIDNWKRAGNTLLLKLALQISSVEADLARSVINEVVTSNNYIVDNSQNLAVRFGGQVGSQNPIWTYTNNSLFEDDMAISTRFFNRLNATNDPRMPAFFSRPSGEYITVDNGFRGTPPVAGVRSKFGEYVGGPNGEAPMRLLTNWQRAFILAEAVLRLGISGDAQQLYQEGIRSSMLGVGVSEESINSYFSNNPSLVTLSGSNEQRIEQIINQKYISLFGNGLEQWNDWRRTGYPQLAEHQNAIGVVEVERPRRAVYINEELQRNPNFPQGTPPQNHVRVWWDVQ